MLFRENAISKKMQYQSPDPRSTFQMSFSLLSRPEVGLGLGLLYARAGLCRVPSLLTL